MITLLAKIFIKNEGENTRKQYGTLCSIVGILLNVLLFAGKYFAGVVSGSIAIMADAFNNLSDAGSSFITLVGFLYAGKKPDLDHPFGHGRFEYISGLAVSLAIILMGVELAKSSVDKIIHPAAVDTSAVAFVVLLVSIAVKLYMAFYNTSVGKKIDSAAMKATAMDSLSDSVATTVVLIAMLILKFTGFNVDGISGLFVAVFILYAGYGAAKETMGPLLGQPPEKEFIDQIEECVMAHSEILGMHDLVVHDYGPGRCLISLHAEVSGEGDIYELHDCIDNIERELHQKLECEAVIHMDPIEVDNENVNQMKTKVLNVVQEINAEYTIHDFRMVCGNTHCNVIFDVVVPIGEKESSEEIEKKIKEKVEQIEEHLYAVITVDRSYVL